MTKEAVIQSILAGAERWKAVKDRQHELKLPLGVSTSDVPLCVLLIDPGTQDQIIERIEVAAQVLARLRADSRVADALSTVSDATAVLALACVVVVDEASSAGACEHLGSDGKCAECTSDRTVNCQSCDETVVASKGRACKTSEEDCGRAYCADCAPGEINEHGYCDDCASLDCDGCSASSERDTEKKCPSTTCTTKKDFCDECAGRLLNSEGLCSACADEEENDCTWCGDTFTDSRFTRCANDACGAPYCADCKAITLSVTGLCPDCRESDG